MESYAGFIELSDTLIAPMTTHSSTLVAAAPDAAPTCNIYSADMASVLVSTLTLLGPITSQTGCYYISQAITSGLGFEAGKKYSAIVSYAISATNYKKIITFNVA